MDVFPLHPTRGFVSLEGDVTVKGEKSHVDMNFSDIWDQMNIGAIDRLRGQQRAVGGFSPTLSMPTWVKRLPPTASKSNRPSIYT